MRYLDFLRKSAHGRELIDRDISYVAMKQQLEIFNKEIQDEVEIYGGMDLRSTIWGLTPMEGNLIAHAMGNSGGYRKGVGVTHSVTWDADRSDWKHDFFFFWGRPI